MKKSGSGGIVGLILFIIGLLAAAYLALKSAPFLEAGFFPWVEALGDGRVFAEPFKISWGTASPIALAVIPGLYLLIVLYASTAKKNKRPGEEYGSASWGNVRALSRKYKDRRSKIDIN